MNDLNNKGQALVMFVLLLPIFILIFVLVIDIGNLIVKQQNINNVNYLVIKDVLDKNFNITNEEIITLIKKNDNEIKEKDININIKNNLIYLKINKEYKGIFSHLINKNIYEINSYYKGEIKDNKKKIERVR